MMTIKNLYVKDAKDAETLMTPHRTKAGAHGLMKFKP